MNNNKLIRLTESDLHRIVRESVNKVLNEVQFNELDPRTYANYARGREAQGQTFKAQQGREAATNAWNQEYGKKESNPNGFWSDTQYGKMGGYDNHYYQMPTPFDDNYKTERWQSMNFPGANDVHAHETYTTYDPKTNQRTSLRYDDMDGETVGTSGHAYYNRPGFAGYRGKYPTQRQIKSDGYGESDDVAQQMSNGTGQYIKGKGWQ